MGRIEPYKAKAGPWRPEGRTMVNSSQRQTIVAILALLLVAAWWGTDTVTAQTVAETATAGPYADGWRMAGANPQRTSWVPEEVPGQLQLEWYKPFGPYISTKVQVIAADGMLFVATARGLYALDAETGAEKWVYPTPMPLGHSPTVLDGVAYVGCFDRRVHAIDARTGKGLWVSAPAGAGFNVNPVVAGGRVFAGNRDGSLYAFDAATGKSVWRSATELGEPILFSCALADGLLYFAANDGCAYAVDAESGKRVWKSDRLPGAGFFSYWPVVYRDRVIFTGSINERPTGSPCMGPGGIPCSEDAAMYGPDPENRKHGAYGAAAGDADVPWPRDRGLPTLDFSRASANGTGPYSDYLEAKPWRRTYFMFDRRTGREITFDWDHDGKPDYAPLPWHGTHSGTRYPPIVAGDGLLYQLAGGVNGGGYISQGGILRWKMDTPLLGALTTQHAHDEPSAIAGGGNQVYCFHGEGPDGGQGVSDIVTGASPGYYWYLASLAPEIPKRMTDRPNDVYNNHGTQNAPIPYRGKVYNHRWNAVLCFSPKGGKQALPVAADPAAPAAAAPQPGPDALRARLAAEVEKMIAAGHLRPGWFTRGLSTAHVEVITDNLEDYFAPPGETIEILIRALPHLDAALRERTRAYIQAEFNAYPPDKVAHIGWRGAGREACPPPPEMERAMQSMGPREGSSGRVPALPFPPQANQALLAYAKEFGSPADLAARVRRTVPTPPDGLLKDKRWAHNAVIAGLAGAVDLGRLADTPDVAAEAELGRLLKLRAENFSKIRSPCGPLPAPGTEIKYGSPQWIAKNSAVPMTVSDNFLYLTPVLAAHLRASALPKVAEAWAEYNDLVPYWFVSKSDEGYQENVFNLLCDYHTMFQARAQILKAPYAELVKYLDVPAFHRGDLYYIDNLCACLEAAATK